MLKLKKMWPRVTAVLLASVLILAGKAMSTERNGWVPTRGRGFCLSFLQYSSQEKSEVTGCGHPLIRSGPASPAP